MRREDLGPYSSESETWAEPLARAVKMLHDEGHVQSGDRDGLVVSTRLAALVQTCERAGVELGAYDLRVLHWLARGEGGPVQVVIGLLNRASEERAPEGPT